MKNKIKPGTVISVISAFLLIFSMALPYLTITHYTHRVDINGDVSYTASLFSSINISSELKQFYTIGSLTTYGLQILEKAVFFLILAVAAGLVFACMKKVYLTIALAVTSAFVYLAINIVLNYALDIIGGTSSFCIGLYLGYVAIIGILAGAFISLSYKKCCE